VYHVQISILIVLVVLIRIPVLIVGGVSLLRLMGVVVINVIILMLSVLLAQVIWFARSV
jgi:hypothetical protein